jgi:hypothetical protein
MEHLKRENILFEGYLLRNFDPASMDEEQEDKKSKKKKEKN